MKVQHRPILRHDSIFVTPPGYVHLSWPVMVVCYLYGPSFFLNHCFCMSCKLSQHIITIYTQMIQFKIR